MTTKLRQVRLGETRHRSWDDIAFKIYGAEILGWNVHEYAMRQYGKHTQPRDLYGNPLMLPVKIGDFNLYSFV